jgi:hypothetical protein
VDLECDLHSIYGILDPYEELTGPQYFQRAYRIWRNPNSIVRSVWEEEQEKRRPKSPEEIKELRKAGALSPEEEKAAKYGAMLGQGSRKG